MCSSVFQTMLSILSTLCRSIFGGVSQVTQWPTSTDVPHEVPFWSPLWVPLPLPVESPESTPSEASGGRRGRKKWHLKHPFFVATKSIQLIFFRSVEPWLYPCNGLWNLWNSHHITVQDFIHLYTLNNYRGPFFIAHMLAWSMCAWHPSRLMGNESDSLRLRKIWVFARSQKNLN